MSASPGASCDGFPPAERQRLLALPRIGPRVVARLESVGFRSLAGMRAAGLDAVVQAVCQQVGSRAWTNRRRALAPALAPVRD
jgi:hypothetical protein